MFFRGKSFTACGLLHRSSFWIGKRLRSNILISKSFSLPTVRLNASHITGTPSGLTTELSKRISLAPQFYKHAPVVIDAEDINQTV